MAAVTRSGVRGPNGWYVNDAAKLAYAAAATDARLRMPVLFLHAAWDANCDTHTSTLAEPNRAHCDVLDEVTLQCGHWMPEARPREANAAVTGWLARRLGSLWRR